MKYMIAAIFLLASAGSMADKPDVLPGNNGDNGYHYGREGNPGNHFRASQNAAEIPEAGTLALIGLGLAGLSITYRIRK